VEYRRGCPGSPEPQIITYAFPWGGEDDDAAADTYEYDSDAAAAAFGGDER